MIFRFALFKTRCFSCQTTQKLLNSYQLKENQLTKQIHIKQEEKKKTAKNSERREEEGKKSCSYITKDSQI